jgi:hypothetical protein
MAFIERSNNNEEQEMDAVLDQLGEMQNMGYSKTTKAVNKSRHISHWLRVRERSEPLHTYRRPAGTTSFDGIYTPLNGATWNLSVRDTEFSSSVEM